MPVFRERLLDDWTTPLDTQEGVLSADVQQARVRRNIKSRGNVLVPETPAPTVLNTAGNLTYTAAQLITGIIARDPAAANRADVLPTAALLVAAMKAAFGRVAVGDKLCALLTNTAAGANTITLTVGAGGTAGSPKVTTALAQNTSMELQFRITNVGTGTEAYTVYA